MLLVTASADTVNSTAPDAFGCGINTGGSVGLAQGDSWRSVDLTTNTTDTCSTQTALVVAPGNLVARVVISGAEASTGVLGGNIAAILYADSGSFGLLGSADNQVEARELSDTPKK